MRLEHIPITCCFFLSLAICDSALAISLSTFVIFCKRSSLVDLRSSRSMGPASGPVGLICSTWGWYPDSWKGQISRWKKNRYAKQKLQFVFFNVYCILQKCKKWPFKKLILWINKVLLLIDLKSNDNTYNRID